MGKYKIPFTIWVYNRDVKNKNIAKVVTRGGEIRKIDDILDVDVDYPVIVKSSKRLRHYDKDGRYSYSISCADHIEDLFIEYKDIPRGTPVIFKSSISSIWKVGHYHAENLVSIPIIPDYMSSNEIIPVNEFDFINLCRLK